MKRLIALVDLGLFYMKEVIQSNVALARDVLLPGRRLRPGIVRIDTNALSERQMVVLANLVTMTPGTLTIGLSVETRQLVIHTLYANRAAELQASITHHYERRISNAF